MGRSGWRKMARDYEKTLTDRIEITPEMIAAGLEFLDRRGLNMLTTQTSYPEFVEEFFKSIIVGGRLRNSTASL